MDWVFTLVLLLFGLSGMALYAWQVWRSVEMLNELCISQRASQYFYEENKRLVYRMKEMEHKYGMEEQVEVETNF